MEMTRRQARIARIIREVASRVILYELADPRIGLVTVTRAEPSRDNRHAKVYVSVMGTREEIDRTLRGIRNARSVIQAEVAGYLTTRFSPVLTFVEDESIKRSIRMSQLIKETLKEDGLDKPAERTDDGTQETGGSSD